MTPTHLEVGRIDRAHGVRGEVVVSLVTNRTERVAPGAVLFAAGRPLTVASARPHQHRWLVGFEGITDRSEAERLRGAVLEAEAIVDADELWVHELVGSTVVDSRGTAHGTVVAVEANPASDLLVLDDETLVPLCFVVDGPTDGVVTVDVPDGLF